VADPHELRRDHVPDWPLRRWVRWRYFSWLPQLSEFRTVYLDVRAWLGGWCNHCPRTAGDPGGGYGHWRCERRRGHEGMHRVNNYVWDDNGQTDYLPVPPNGPGRGPRSPWPRRHLRGSWRHRMQQQARRREREKAPRD